MSALVGRMKVEQLARLAGVALEELVAAVLASGGVVPTSQPSPAPTRGRTLDADIDPAPAPTQARAVESFAVAPLPELGRMVGRATYRQLHFEVDRWLLGHVWEQEGHNVSRAASRLEISRRRFRELFARTTRDATGRPASALAGRPSEPVPPPALESLLPAGTYREIHDEVDRWLLGHVLEWTQGNLTHAARHLAVSRKHLREHLARVGLR